jgi:pectate lyase
MDKKIVLTIGFAAGIFAVIYYASASLYPFLSTNRLTSQVFYALATPAPFQNETIRLKSSGNLSANQNLSLNITSSAIKTQTFSKTHTTLTYPQNRTTTPVPSRTWTPVRSRTLTRTPITTKTQTNTGTLPTRPVRIITPYYLKTYSWVLTRRVPSKVVVITPAFPGAEGFGVKTIGGRRGKVIEVTNLNDSGPGSLREAINATGSRIVVFRVAGTIGLNTSLRIINPYITIAGQSAPGGGITLRGLASNTDPLMEITAHDVVVRYLTFRAGPPSPGDDIAIQTENHDTYNIVIDHISASWSVGRILMTWYDVHDIAIQWNILSEGLDCSINPKGCHSKGALLGGYASDENKTHSGAYNFSFHHNLMAHNGERNPLVTMSGVCDVVNNVAYDPQNAYGQVDMQYQKTQMMVNFVGNYFKPGIDTDSGEFGISTAHEGSLGAKIFVQGNIGPMRWDDSQPQADIVEPSARKYVTSSRNQAPQINTTSALDAYTSVLAEAGSNRGLNCDGSFFDRRDAIDTRVINNVQNGAGQIINDPSDVGGYLTIPSATACADSDHDGMPDTWEAAHGFDLNDPTDASQDLDGDGYTNVEEFLNGTKP